MKYIFFVCTLLLIMSCREGTHHFPFSNTPDLSRIVFLDEVNTMIDSAKTNSIYRNDVDWNKIRTQMYLLAEDATDLIDLTESTTFLFEELKDNDGLFVHNCMYFQAKGGYKEDPHTSILHEIRLDIFRGVKYPPIVQQVDNKIGYLRISSFDICDNIIFSEIYNDKICLLRNSGIDKWIIDLRYINRGKIEKLIEIITPLLGDGKIGGTKGLTAEEDVDWMINNGEFYKGKTLISTNSNCLYTTSPPIAVLISNYTSSGGEWLSIMLKERGRTSFFGQGTRGIKGVQSKIYLTDSIRHITATTLRFTKAFPKDRFDTVYSEYVKPDVEKEFTPSNMVMNDSCIISAVSWLNEK